MEGSGFQYTSWQDIKSDNKSWKLQAKTAIGTAKFYNLKYALK